MMRGYTLITMALLVAGSLMLGGCQKQSDISYYSEPAGFDDFDSGADRPPTARTLYSMARMLSSQGKSA